MCILFSITLVNRVVWVSQGAARSAWAACGAQAARLNSLWSLWPDMAQVLSASEPFLMNVRECLNFRIHHNVWSETRVRKSKSNTLYATQCPNVVKGCVGMIFHKIPTLQAHTHKDRQDAKVPRHGFLAQVKRPGLSPYSWSLQTEARI